MVYQRDGQQAQVRGWVRVQSGGLPETYRETDEWGGGRRRAANRQKGQGLGCKLSHVVFKRHRETDEQGGRPGEEHPAGASKVGMFHRRGLGEGSGVGLTRRHAQSVG